MAVPASRPHLSLESVPATAKIDNRPWLDKKLAAFMELHKTQQHAYELFKGDVLLDYEFSPSPLERRSPTRWSTICSPDCDGQPSALSSFCARLRSLCVMPPASCVDSDIVTLV